jgi:hypothetical protein
MHFTEISTAGNESPTGAESIKQRRNKNGIAPEGSDLLSDSFW